MRWGRVLPHRLRSVLRPGSAETDLQRELDVHLEQLMREHLAAGLTEVEARRAARRDFGWLESTKEECRDMRRVTFVEDLVKDLGYAVRLLRKSPGFTLTAICSLALGIGANTAIFSIVNAYLLRPLPYDRPDRLVVLFERNVVGDEQDMALAPGNFFDWQSASTTFQSMSAYTTRTTTVGADTAGAEPERVGACACSGTLFATLGVQPRLGRPFSPEEDRFGVPRVVIIGEQLWQRQFHGAADTIGKTIRVNEVPHQIVGVMPRGFMFPYRTIEVWTPLAASLPPSQQVRHDLHFLQAVGRLRDGVPMERARAEIDALAAQYKSAHPNESTAKGAALVPLHEFLVRGVRTLLLVLLGAVACVLLIACVNIANLMFTRAAARAREIGIRAALGAGRGRIIRQLVTESIVLGVAGGAAGGVLAVWLADSLVTRAPGADVMLPSGRVPIDPIVFVFACAVAIGTGVLVGLVPAIRGSRADAASDLKEGGRSATAGRAQARVRNLLVTAEVSLSLVLLVAAGLLFHSFSRLYEVQPGVRMDRMVTLSTTLPQTRYRTATERSAFFADLTDRLRALPGVVSAGLSSCTPLSGACNALFLYIEGRPYEPGKFLTAHERSVDPGYFSTAGIPLLKGRTFTREDGVGFDAQHPRLGKIVISQAMAKTFFGDEDPIGKRIFFDYEVQRERNEQIPAPRYEIVGVVGDVLPFLEGRMTPTLYRPILDNAVNGVTILVHSAGEPEAVIGSVRNEMRRIDPGLVLFQVRTMAEHVGRATADRQFTTLLFTVFAGLAVLLAAVGLYGMVAYAVSQRTAEIGVRMALGATRGDVSRLVVMQGLRPAAIGVVVGLVAAALASRLLESLLFGVAPLDPLTFALVPPLLLAVAGLASYLPALRAARLDPTIALRTE
jgi:putative ABC transport system permease protein